MADKKPKIKEGVIVGNRKAVARQIRTSSKQNSDGSVSTHKMEYGTGEGKYKYQVNPTIFPNKDGTFKDLSGKGLDAYNEAKKRGEVFGFKREKKAEKFAAGSWKKGKDRREAMKEYRKNKKETNPNIIQKVVKKVIRKK
jgi:hypothetical protein